MARAADFQARSYSTISDIAKADWDGLMDGPYNPFASWDFLNALEQSGCATAATGWAGRYMMLSGTDGTFVGAAPLYAKSHSRGEYVFDHGWADAYMRAGGQYYPKLQVSIPFTPAAGPRLLAKTPAAKSALISAMVQAADQWQCSGLHMTFLDEADKEAASKAGMLLREDRQFHFFNRGYDDFDGFLASLSSRKRKNIKKERKAATEDLTIKRLRGDDITPAHWDVFYQCYLDTASRKWGTPYLNRDFFTRIHAAMRDKVLLVIAYDGARPIAAALNFIGGDALYGRNWGALEHRPFLHFELCYYQAIDAAIEMKLARAEAGAQGEHKLARGYEPVATWSAHWLADAQFSAAVADYLTRERRAVEHEINLLGQHTPFKKDQSHEKGSKP